MKPKVKLERAYSLIAEVANPGASEGLKKPRAVLLLWFLRNVMGIDDLEAYEYVCDGENDQGIDGIYLGSEDADDGQHTLYLFQSKYPEKPKNLGVNDLKHFVASVLPFETPGGIRDLLNQPLEPELESLIKRQNLVRLQETGGFKVKLVYVAAGLLQRPARAFATLTCKNKGDPKYLSCYDAQALAPLIEAFRKPGLVSARISIDAGETERFVVTIPAGRLAVASVKVLDVLTWPGIDDRTLFDLNVRRELRRNVVRKSLDRALTKTATHAEFIAYHNGITVVCRRIDDSDPCLLRIDDVSVVNGAQSVVAFHANRDAITPDLRVVVKFVQVNPNSQVAREVAVRSNTQNAINARNLRGRDGVQLKLLEEFKDKYPRIAFETRPDRSHPARGHVIQNDDAAQLLCSVCNQKPWLAVKRLSLFDADNYPQIFNSEITASHIILVDAIGRAVENLQSQFPEPYRKAWKLTKLTAAYLVGQILRCDPELSSVLTMPAKAVANMQKLTADLEKLARFAAATMKIRADRNREKGEHDDYKVEFKREASLKELGQKARENYINYTTMKGVA
jgi:hypothetical protein